MDKIGAWFIYFLANVIRGALVVIVVAFIAMLGFMFGLAMIVTIEQLLKAI